MSRATLAVPLLAALVAPAVAQPRPPATKIATLAAPAPALSFNLATTGTTAAVVSTDGKLRLWSLPNGRLLRTIDVPGRQYWIAVSAITDDGRSVAVADENGGVTVWDVSTGQSGFHFQLPHYPAIVQFSHDSKRLALAAATATVEVFDVAARRKLYELERPSLGAAAVAFSRDGSLLAAADVDTVIRMYDARTGRLMFRNTDLLLEPLAVDFTADGKQVVAAGADKVVVVIEAATGKTVRRMKKLSEPVMYVWVSADGKFLATALMKADNLELPAPVGVWEIASGQQLADWLPATRVLGGGWTTDGRLLVAISAPGSVQIWRLR